jgi:4-amino-4-deoxy-L-arabinose transferase-like glycosyltransferase
MLLLLNRRFCHYLLLIAAALALTLPNLGTPSLWDIDEGNNADAAREMMESGNWVVPTFNYELRVDKPALLYWLQIAAYRSFGVNEFSARLPSLCAALVTVLLVYELARRMFGRVTGLLAGLILASSAGFCAAAHFANPDALLNAFTVLTFLVFWLGLVSGGRWWFIPAGISAGLAVLAKGPVGLVLPLAVAICFLFWTGQLRRLCDRALLLGTTAFLIVSLPWYIWVAAETKAKFLRGFILTHNVGRFLGPMENHGGPVYYYLLVLVIFFAPWSVFLGWVIWDEIRRRPCTLAAEPNSVSHPLIAKRFLWCWIGVYVVFFSVSRTKLPNYILPVYAPVAMLTACYLENWRRGTVQVQAWRLSLSLACLAMIGIGLGAALICVSGRLPVLPARWRIAGLDECIGIALIPVAGAVSAWCFWRREQRTACIVCLNGCAILFMIGLFALGAIALDGNKGPRALVTASGARQTDHDVRVGCYEYFQPSLVFYCRREVVRLKDDQETLDFLRSPLPVFLFVPEEAWQRLQPHAPAIHHVAARHHDLYRSCEVVVVTNN